MSVIRTLLVTAGVVACLYLFLIHPRWPRRPLAGLAGYMYAHRGLWDEMSPENSLPAFQAAAEAGYGIELDVQMTRDGILVVFHDDTTDRMCGVPGHIRDRTWAELQSLRLQGGQERIPSLDEVLEVVHGRVPLIVEIKSCPGIRALCRRTADRLMAYSGPYCVESFDPRAVWFFRWHAPDVIRGQLAFSLKGGGGHRKTAGNYLLGTLIQNALSRPDFVAFETVSDDVVSLSLVGKLGAHLVGWTARSQEEVNEKRDRYELFIFESFRPELTAP